MAKTSGPKDTSPHDFPESTPRDLYPTSDIRFVLVKIGELTAKVDSLVNNVDRQGDKIDDLQHKVSFVKGAIWVFGVLLAILIAATYLYLSGNISITLQPNP